MATCCFFVHSTATLPSMWNGVPAEVVGASDVVAPANLGYPPNPLLARGVSVDVHDEVAHLFAKVPADADTIHLFGHSYGAAVAMLLAEKLGARVRSMFLLEPVLFGALANARDEVDPAGFAEAEYFLVNGNRFVLDEDFGGTDPWIEQFIDYWNRPGSWQRLPEPQKAFIRKVGWKMFQEVRSCARDIPSFDAVRLPRVPVTLGLGTQTTAGARAMTLALSRRHPHAVLVELAAGHMAPLTHPTLVHEAMRRHMARVNAGNS